MTVLPFDAAARAPAGSLLDAYPSAAIRSFVEKLRQLAILRPTTCVVWFRMLDQLLAGMLEDVVAGRPPTPAPEASWLPSVQPAIGPGEPVTSEILSRLLDTLHVVSSAEESFVVGVMAILSEQGEGRLIELCQMAEANFSRGAR